MCFTVLYIFSKPWEEGWGLKVVFEKNSCGSMALSHTNAWMFTGLGNEVNLSISNASLQLSGSETPISSSGHSQLVCSYNWAHKTQPTIYVPGNIEVMPRLVCQDRLIPWNRRCTDL